MNKTSTIKVSTKDRIWLGKQKERLNLKNLEVTFERVVQLIKKHKMESEI